MLEKKQIAPLVVLAVLLWAVVAIGVRLVPAAFVAPAARVAGFVLAFPIGFLCIGLARRLARVVPGQYVAATALVAAVAMCIDALALQLAPHLYGAGEAMRRLVASWLLWCYGAALLVAFGLAARASRSSRAATAAMIAP